MSFADRPAVCQAPECGATIVFRHNAKSGKWQPFDVAPVTCKACGGEGVVRLVEQSFLDDEASESAMPCSKCGGRGMVDSPHHATCANAGAFRRSK